jgi:hypothetical protein
MSVAALWNDDLFSRLEPELIVSIRNRLSGYPILSKSRNELAGLAIHRTRSRLSHVKSCEDEKYVSGGQQFRVWFREIAYREAVRLATLREEVLYTIRRIDVMPRRLLYWSYLDQMSVLEIAKTLNLIQPTGKLFRDEEAGKLIRRSVRGFFQRLEALHPLDGESMSVSIAFPLPPNMPKSLFDFTKE